MLEHGAHAARSAFRTQGQGFFVAVEEGVHLLVDHVGAFTDAAGEELGELEDRQADFLVAVAIQQHGQGVLQVAPGRRLLRQDVVHATNGLQGLAHEGSLIQLRAITAASASAFSAAFSRMSRSSSSTRLSLFSFCAGLPSM
ncbi:hypothetical protein D3C81_1872440 [compost metagenome]